MNLEITLATIGLTKEVIEVLISLIKKDTQENTTKEINEAYEALKKLIEAIKKENESATS